MVARRIVFDINSLVRLMCHYSNGMVPPDADVRIAGPHRFLKGWWGMVLASRNWPIGTRMEDPLVFRYEGKKNMRLNKGGGWAVTDGPHS